MALNLSEQNGKDSNWSFHLPRYEDMQKVLKLSPVQLEKKGIFAVHPGFRLVCLANSPTSKNPWLTSEVMSMFHFHILPGKEPERHC
jgi:hypothetical protein